MLTTEQSTMDRNRMSDVNVFSTARRNFFFLYGQLSVLLDSYLAVVSYCPTAEYYFPQQLGPEGHRDPFLTPGTTRGRHRKKLVKCKT